MSNPLPDPMTLYGYPLYNSSPAAFGYMMVPENEVEEVVPKILEEFYPELVLLKDIRGTEYAKSNVIVDLALTWNRKTFVFRKNIHGVNYGIVRFDFREAPSSDSIHRKQVFSDSSFRSCVYTYPWIVTHRSGAFGKQHQSLWVEAVATYRELSHTEFEFT